MIEKGVVYLNEKEDSLVLRIISIINLNYMQKIKRKINENNNLSINKYLYWEIKE